MLAKAIVAVPNTHGAHAATTQKNRDVRATAGTRGRDGRGPLAGGCVSGTFHTSTAATTVRTTCTTNGVTCGAGRNCASSPAASGEAATPAESTTVARRGPAPGRSVLSCLTHADPDAMAIPTPKPMIQRPGYSSQSVVWDAAASTRDATRTTASAGRITARRPRWSETGPSTSSAGTRPAA